MAFKYYDYEQSNSFFGKKKYKSNRKFIKLITSEKGRFRELALRDRTNQRQ